SASFSFLGGFILSFAVDHIIDAGLYFLEDSLFGTARSLPPLLALNIGRALFLIFSVAFEMLFCLLPSKIDQWRLRKITLREEADSLASIA
ncbi:hypothetical protein PMAYCL1PPCAC_10536, partial [Pristionchus mayeri]